MLQKGCVCSRTFVDLIGKIFGRLTVISYLGKNKKAQREWVCQCVCGQKLTLTTASIFAGHTNSCGCLQKELLIARRRIHGESRSKEFRIWSRMKGRCESPAYHHFKDYGGRGITVCERWQRFQNFLDDMGRCPPKMSIERKDVNGNYEPSNCKWATAIEQANNRRNSLILTFNGKTQTVSQWSRELGFIAGTIGRRLARGWAAGKALSTPLKPSRWH